MKRIQHTVLALPLSNSSRTLPALMQFTLASCALMLAGCSFNNPPTGPDVTYADTANEARSLQVPPDLTNVSNGEQFILPGAEPGPLSRNRLLPSITGATYVRRGDQNWLEFNQAAETIWPLLLEYIRKEKWIVEKTAPTTGLIFTQWRSDDEKSGGLLKNLISGDDLLSRVAFRLERNGNGTRLFARSMQLSSEAIEGGNGDVWPPSSHDPEQVSEVLKKLLVFVGIEEQRAQGILSEPQASAILDDVHLQTTAAGSQLLVHKAFSPSFIDVKSAITKLPYTILLSDGSVGTIQFAANVEAMPLLVSLTPLHISAVSVKVTQAGGERLDKAQELEILSAIQEQLI